MNISKNIPLANLQINKFSNNRTMIWLNSYDSCILRIQNLNIIPENFDKFQFIDIHANGAKAIVSNDTNLSTDETNMNNFLLGINEIIISSAKNIDLYNNRDFFNKLSDFIKKELYNMEKIDGNNP